MLHKQRRTIWLTAWLAAQVWLVNGIEPIRASRLPPLPESLGVAGAFAGVVNDSLLVAGGANFPDAPPWKGGKKVWHDTIYLLSETNGDWKVIGKLPRPLAYGVSVTTRDGIVCVGGSDAQRNYADCFRFSLKDGKLRVDPLPRLPVSLANAAGALVGDTIYVAGGSEEPGEQSATGNLYSLNLSATRKGWTKLAPCPGKPRILPLAASLGEDFYLVGGAALERTNGTVNRTYLREAWRFRPGSGWTKIADMPRACVAAPSPAPAVRGRFYVLSGDDGTARDFQPIEKHPGFTRTILAFDAKSETWKGVGESPAPRVTAPVAYWRDWFVVSSGEVRPGVRSSDVWMFQVISQ